MWGVCVTTVGSGLGNGVHGMDVALLHTLQPTVEPLQPTGCSLRSGNELRDALNDGDGEGQRRVGGEGQMR